MTPASSERDPVAPHRLAPRGWTRLISLVAVLVVFGGLGYGAVWYSEQADETGWLSWLPWIDSAEPTPSATTSPSPSATVTASPSPSPTVVRDYNFNASIILYNLSGDPALVTRLGGMLQSEEFSTVVSGDWSGTTPPANVVRFEKPELQDTANLVASILGIKTVTSGATGGQDIAVLLLSDPFASSEPSPSPSPSD